MNMENPRRQPMHVEISEAMIKALVHAFCSRIREGIVLGFIFSRVIGDDWGSRLARVCDFWSSIMRMSSRYKDNSTIAHMRLKMVKSERFERWLALFQETAQGAWPPDIAALFRKCSGNIARILQLGMFFRVDARRNIGGQLQEQPERASS